MRGVRITGLIMTGVMVAEAWPLGWEAAGPRGWAALLALLGWHAPVAGFWGWGLGAIVAVGYVALSMASLRFIRVKRSM